MNFIRRLNRATVLKFGDCLLGHPGDMGVNSSISRYFGCATH